MKHRDFLVTGDGQYQVCKPYREWDLLRETYRLHRFLTEVEDVLDRATDENQCLPELRLLVRRLVVNSYWIHVQHPEPCPKTGNATTLLYDEIGYPLTVQTTTLSPGTISPIHNHGTWGVVAVLQGEEKNTFWKRSPVMGSLNRIARSGEMTLLPGDIISFTPDAIHCVEALGEEPAITFSIYGETHHSRRFQFDPLTCSAKNF
ncbi:cupin [Chroococcidiopsis sp.]|uniref:cupin n=1 Tax=Chroococcidiopsis sp. TaxID=3088168 RepID=UPI003F3FB89D